MSSDKPWKISPQAAALHYALTLKMKGIPCAANKKPIAALVPNGLLNATRDEAQIREWARRAPFFEFGWVPPWTIGIVDCDVGAGFGENGLRDFERFIGIHPDAIATPQCAT